MDTHSVAWMQCEAALYGERYGDVVRLSEHVPCRMGYAATSGELLLDREIVLEAAMAGSNGRVRIRLLGEPQHYFEYFMTPSPFPGETAILRPACLTKYDPDPGIRKRNAARWRKVKGCLIGLAASVAVAFISVTVAVVLISAWAAAITMLIEAMEIEQLVRWSNAD